MDDFYAAAGLPGRITFEDFVKKCVYYAINNSVKKATEALDGSHNPPHRDSSGDPVETRISEDVSTPPLPDTEADGSPVA